MINYKLKYIKYKKKYLKLKGGAERDKLLKNMRDEILNTMNENKSLKKLSKENTEISKYLMRNKIEKNLPDEIIRIAEMYIYIEDIIDSIKYNINETIKILPQIGAPYIKKKKIKELDLIKILNFIYYSKDIPGNFKNFKEKLFNNDLFIENIKDIIKKYPIVKENFSKYIEKKQYNKYDSDSDF